MSSTKPQVTVSPDELPDKFLEACNIMLQMRIMKKKWDIHFGAANRNNLRTWEEKADKFLRSLNIQPEDKDDK